jgi:ribosomal-protein-alanine N-acetyltransferase
MKYFLTSTSLGFRLWNNNDISLAEKLWGNRKVAEFIASGGIFSRKQIQEKLKGEIQTQKDYGIQYWPVFLKEGNIFIGCCGLRPYDINKSILEIGVHLLPDHWGKGYASEALNIIIEYAFNKIKVSDLFAGHNPMNEASKRLLSKLGFRYTHDEYYPPTGLNHPSYLLTHRKS